MEASPENDPRSFDLDQVAAGFASALVTAQLIDEQMDEMPTLPLDDVQALAVRAATRARFAIDKARMPDDLAN